MADFDNQDPLKQPTPDATGAPEPAGPPPASSPYLQPPMPGTTPHPSEATGAYPPQAPYAPPYPQSPYPPQAAQAYGAYPPPPQQPTYQQPAQQPYNAGPTPPAQPYPGQPYPVTPPNQPKRMIWPWALAGCLLIFLLGIGGCVSCTACSVIGALNDRPTSTKPGYDFDFKLNEGYHDDPDNPFSPNWKPPAYGLTLDEIKDMDHLSDGQAISGKYTPGVYEVGVGKDIEPGLYYMEGDPTQAISYTIYAAVSPEYYQSVRAINYFGNYFANLKEGDVLAWDAPDNLRFYPAEHASFKPTAPYQSGLYRVGKDIPAGVYNITINPALKPEGGIEPGAFVMSDLEFSTFSITDEKHVLPGGSQAITVKDGDWLELYAAQATPAE